MIRRRRPPISTSPDVGQPAPDAVGVPERHGGDVGRGRRACGAARTTAARRRRGASRTTPGRAATGPDGGRPRPGRAPAPGEMPYTAMPARTNERRAAGWARPPAELAACTATPSSAPAGSPASTRSNVASCPAVYGSAGSSATARWVKIPVSRTAGVRAAMWATRIAHVAGRGADAVHAGVDLDVHPETVGARRRRARPRRRSSSRSGSGRGPRSRRRARAAAR